MARTARTIGGMVEQDALQVAYDAAYLEYTKVWDGTVPSHTQCDHLISEYRHSHPTKVIGAVSHWLCDRKAWDSSPQEDNRRYNATRKAYRTACKKYGA